MRVILLILFILLIAELVVLFFFLSKRKDKYDSGFVGRLHDKMIEYVLYPYPDIFKEFEKLFVEYKTTEILKIVDDSEYFAEVIKSIFNYVALEFFCKHVEIVLKFVEVFSV